MLYVYTLPGMLRLRKEANAASPMTTAEATEECRRTGLKGWPLVEYAQKLAASRFRYSRRNNWDSPSIAFRRGYGYCQQQALALKQIYDRLGIKAKPVYCLKCEFPPKAVHGIPEPGRISPHTWLRVTIDGNERDVCCGNPNNGPGKVHFKVLGDVRALTPWIRLPAHIGSMIKNVRRDNEAIKSQRRGIR